MLIRSAFSSNIKERRDCSTALFDRRGRMSVQAEHIPVHLGAMPEAVAAVMERDPAPGDIYAINDPFTGGTHLPDITLVSRTEVGFAVSRAHHADVGGMEPSSLPAESRELYQEGVIIPPTRLDEEVLRVLVANMRNPDERRGDLRAQIAAQRLAERRIAELCASRGRAKVEAGMADLFDHSERHVRAGIAALPDGRYEARDVLEPVEGTLEIHVAVTIDGDEIDPRLRRDLLPARRKPELSARRHPLRLLLRRPVSHRARHPGVGRRLRPGHCPCPGGLARQRGRSRRGGCGEHRDLESDHRRPLRGVRPGRHRPGAGPGDDEQRHPRKPATSRTTRRSEAARARAPAATARRRCTSRCRTR